LTACLSCVCYHPRGKSHALHLPWHLSQDRHRYMPDGGNLLLYRCCWSSLSMQLMDTCTKRSGMEQWLKEHVRSPVTNAKLTHSTLLAPNIVLCSIIAKSAQLRLCPALKCQTAITCCIWLLRLAVMTSSALPYLARNT